MSTKMIAGVSAAIVLIAGLYGYRALHRHPLKAGEATPPMSAASLAGPEPPPVTPKPDDLAAHFDQWLSHVPADRYDMAAKAATFGPRASAALLFVRDRIRYEAYSGVLRGAEQTFLAGAGNSLDRSLLLASLLKLNGVTVRFASGHLSPAKAEKLFDSMFDVGRGMPAADRVPGAAAFLARVTARGRRDADAIRTALGGKLPVGAAASRGDVLAEIEKHVWVQAQIDDQWVDLDSAFADAVPGRAYCDVEETFDQLPADSFQHVVVRVTADTLVDDAVSSATLLEVDFAAVDLLDKQIFLTHTPAASTALGGLGGASGGGGAWIPVLWVDGETHAGEPLDFVTGGQSGGGGFGLFGGGSDTNSSSAFVAEWLEFDILFPDGRHEVTRRELVDRAGAAWRKAAPNAQTLHPLEHDEHGLFAPQALHNIWFSAGRHDLAAYGDAVMSLVRGQEKAPEQSPPPSSMSFGEQVWPLALQNFAFLVWSDHFIVPAVNDSPDVRLYPDSPRILMFSLGLRRGAKGAVVYGEYDLRRDFLRGVARDASGDAGIVDRKIRFGALEGALERESGVRDAVFSGSDPGRVASTSDLLTSAGAIALVPADASRGDALAADPEEAARMQLALANRNVLVVPHAPGKTSGWWEVAPSGDTRAVMVPDLNITITEYRAPGVSNGFPGTYYDVDPATGRAIRHSPFSPKREKKLTKGEEYTELVRAVAITIVESAVIMATAAYLQNLLNHSRAALDGVAAADGGSGR
jgi:transglutaminase-like putative cysteine protease